MVNELEARVKEVIQRTYNVKSVRLQIEAEAPFRAGQFMSVALGDKEGYQRYLSISSSPTEYGYLEFTKKITGSDFSKSIDTLKPGDSLRIKYPFGKFTLEDNPAQKIAFLSGGIGITPIRSICKYAADKRLNLDIVLLYASMTFKDIVFKDDFDAMQKAYPNLRVAHVLCKEEPGFLCSIGLINSSLVKKEIPDYTQRKFFLCGPPPMVEAMKGILSNELSLSQENIVTENFQGY
ncbi:MAG TPA: FAD-binding oxidoreductase [Candidatus Margulisiibacteriota bacterium]|nr:FAD-binding oxidoreductase [Candidatus Margulisiibacteriota bacterium]